MKLFFTRRLLTDIMKSCRFGTVLSGFGILLPSFFLGGCLSVPDNTDLVSRYFPDNPRPVLRYLESNGRRIHYAEMGDEQLPLVVFVHGTPGSWTAFAHFLRNTNLLQVSRMISVDRPGFGNSGDGRWEKRLEDHASLLEPVLNLDNSGRGAILVGHSYGGPVIARMAMDYPEKVAGIIMVAASVDPDLEHRRWYHLMAMMPPFRWVTPKPLLAANAEIFPLKGELKKMLPFWEELTMPVTVIQGGRDKLVNPGNPAFVERVAVNAPQSIQLYPEINHFIPWSHPQLIEDAILKMLAE